MRIACMGFAHIRDTDGRHLLLLNKGRLEHNGQRILSPVGGGLKVGGKGKRLLSSLGATDFEGDGNELRFRVPDTQVWEVATWFTAAHAREASVRRELEEDLIEETGVLTPSDLVGMTETFRGCPSFQDTTLRDVPEKQTTYLIDLFDVTPGPTAMAKLRAASQVPLDQRWIHFVSKAEIIQGATADGVTIGRISSYIL